MQKSFLTKNLTTGSLMPLPYLI
uniref:Uncharacterized protein n=1 Tax=Anguilla anguilla TaxID=7936 RepID=A0A0E9RE55_ANGAN